MVILYFIVGFVVIALFIEWVIAMSDIKESEDRKRYQEELRKRQHHNLSN